MSARFPFPTKLNPIWWLGNADEPTHPDHSRLGWWLRNPFHNLTHYVLGCADRRRLRIGPGNGGNHLILQFWPPFVCPYICHWGARWEGYLGWREDGELGARFTLK